ncbi:MAG: hypothetical protein EXR93_05750 [Gemmatimonadetes bacterium]|nr:hypothetical protein [Gemmatimonadota bacterium]
MLTSYRSFLALGVVAATSACGLFDGGSDTPRPIVYTALHNTREDVQIHVSDDLGHHPKKITDTPGEKAQPAWSPDGAKIAFSWETESQILIYTMNADGSTPVQITPKLTSPNVALYDSPAWAPSGTQLAYGVVDGGPIRIINIDGSGLRQLTPANISADDPAWSPNGQKIAFWGVVTAATTPSADIYVINADGTGLVNLTNSVATETDPSWSPDGTKIAYDADGGTSGLKIFVMDASGANPRMVAQHAAGQTFAHPRWSPDGAHLVFGSADGIWTVNLDGTNLRLIITDRLATDPDWH